MSVVGGFELDHVLVWVSPGAPEGDGLVRFGLTEGSPNVHVGQGTANRRFFFHNAMLELIWVTDEAEARRPPVARLGLQARWRHRETGASPFGLCLRRLREAAAPPFPTWPYSPAYLPAGLALDVALTSDVTREPLVFVAATHRPDAAAPSARQPLVHAARLREITAVRLGVTDTEPLSATLEAVAALGVATFPRERAPRLELGFDGERQSRAVDFQPAVPLSFRW